MHWPRLILHRLTKASPSIRRRSMLQWITGVSAVVLLVSSALACNIPVFRYALERWKPDACEIVLFHDGPLVNDQLRSIEKIKQQMVRREKRDTSSLRLLEISELSANEDSLWKSLRDKHPNAQLPLVNVQMQLGRGRIANAWSGELSRAQDVGIFDSPTRRELAKRLLNGHSVVWIVVQSAHEDPEKREQLDSRVDKILRDNLESLSNSIELPEGIGLPGSELHSEIPLLLKFSLLEIDPRDPKEAFLTGLFTQIQPEAFAEGEPLIVPVFGRGRALEVIPASSFSVRLMQDLSVFLSGACSCQVKEQNPGFDLLMSTDWDTELFGEGVSPPPERTTRDRENPVLLTIPPGR